MVEPLRDELDAVVVFPSMPEVMRLNKVGSFTMQNLGQSKSVVSEFMKKKKKVGEEDGVPAFRVSAHEQTESGAPLFCCSGVPFD